MRSFEWVPNPMTSVLIRRGKFGCRGAQREDDVKTQRKEGRVMTEAEIGVMLPQAKESQRLLAATRS